MTTTPPLPRTLPAWIKALDDAPLPAFAAVHGKVRLALRDASKSMRQIAELIQDSPVLALRFIQEANRGIGDGQPAESLEVALSRIGLQRAEALEQRRQRIAQGTLAPAGTGSTRLSSNGTSISSSTNSFIILEEITNSSITNRFNHLLRFIITTIIHNN